MKFFCIPLSEHVWEELSCLLSRGKTYRLLFLLLQVWYFVVSLIVLLPGGSVQEISISPQGITALTTPRALIRHMQGQSIHCMASGGQAPNFKFFFFAQKAKESSNYLVECIINTSASKAQLKIKADDQSTSEAFSSLLQSALSKFGLPWFVRALILLILYGSRWSFFFSM